MIGGNTEATVQIKVCGGKNGIGERVTRWQNVCELCGWLDLIADNTYTQMPKHRARVQESTHVYLCDYKAMPEVTAENARLIINGEAYLVTLIDDVMFLHDHYEIMLKYVGGGSGEQY